MQDRQGIRGCLPLVVAAAVVLLSVTAGVWAMDPPRTKPPTPPSSQPATQPPDGVVVKAAITYSRPGGKTLNLDLAAPAEGDGPFPAVVCLYGGGWISGSRTRMARITEFLAANGYVAVAPSYRLAPDHPFPAAVADVRQCVRWLRRNAAEYKVDPKRIGAMGLSAGGHLACMLGVTADSDRFGPDDDAKDNVSARVQAVVDFFGPADLTADDWSALAQRKFLVPFMGGAERESVELRRQASPVYYVSADDPPILIFQGDQDRTVPMTQSVGLHEKLKAAGVTCELVIMKGASHGWRGEERARTRWEMLDFFDKHLMDGKPPTRKYGKRKG